MKRATKFFGVLALAAAMVWVGTSTASASCSFSSPFRQGGLLGRTPTAIVEAGGTALGGFFWEAGHGNPADGVGNDSKPTTGFEPAPGGTDNVWISRGLGFPGIDFNWINGGIDGCISGGAGVGVMMFYLLDDAGNYALAGVNGVQTPLPSHDVDTLGQDIVMAPRVASPAIAVDPATCTTNGGVAGLGTCVGDVGAPGLNCIDDDGGAACAANTSFGTQLIRRNPGGGGETPVPGCDAGCAGQLLDRGQEYCWDTNGDGVSDAGDSGDALGAPAVGGGVCANGGFACTSNDQCGECGAPLTGLACQSDANCFGLAACNFALNDCLLPEPTLFGPSIPAGCIEIAGPNVSDVVTTTPAIRNGRFTQFQWQAEQFTIVNFEIVGEKGNGREVALARQIRLGMNDGNLQQYELVLSQGDLKGAKNFKLRTFLTDGSSFDTDF